MERWNTDPSNTTGQIKSGGAQTQNNASFENIISSFWTVLVGGIEPAPVYNYIPARRASPP